MLLPIKHADWQVLRALARSKKPVLGTDLRIAWTHHTKDGAFLTELVRVGLLEVAGPVEGKPFESRYKLTEAGKFAAEYGEYECGIDHVAVADQPEPTAVTSGAQPDKKSKK